MGEKVLFVCIHNSARSQMAEAYFNKYTNGKHISESAGITAGVLNKYVVEVMKEDGIDISNNLTKEVFDLYKKGKIYSHIISVCEETTQKCPIFPGITKRISWSIEDPSGLIGSEKEKIEKTREIRDKIKNKVIEIIEEIERGE
jgi:arsenate reductase (thioredoxin)